MTRSDHTKALSLRDMAPLALLIAIGAFNQTSLWAELNDHPQTKTIAHGLNFDGSAVAVQKLLIDGSLTTIVAPLDAPIHPLALVAHDGSPEDFLKWTQTAHSDLNDKFDVVFWDQQAGDPASVMAAIEARYEDGVFYYPNIGDPSSDAEPPNCPPHLDGCAAVDWIELGGQCNDYCPLPPPTHVPSPDKDDASQPDPLAGS